MRLPTLMVTTILLIAPSSQAQKNSVFDLVPLGSYASGIFNQGAAEILAFDEHSNQVFVVNASDVSVDVISLDNPKDPQKVSHIDISAIGGVANSLAVSGDILAVAVEGHVKQEPGRIAFFSIATLSSLGSVEVGALPDNVIFSKDGRYLLVANEGEPNADYTVDPEGSVSIIDVKGGISQSSVATASFTSFNRQRTALMDAGVRIFGPNATVAQDLEPEYITATNNGRAYVVLQENNAIAEIDIATASVLNIFPLGFKDHSMRGNELDVSNLDGEVNITNWPVLGMYLPDTIASYQVGDSVYLVTANEGDSRDYEGFSEERRVKDVVLDAIAFPSAERLQRDDALGQLKITSTLGDKDGDGDFDKLYAYGGRSFSIWSTTGELVFDSGSDFERVTALQLTDSFNSSDEEFDSADDRSDDKGPEPEGVVVGQVDGRMLAFIGLERISGIMVYDITNPSNPVYQSYATTRNSDVDVCLQREYDIEEKDFMCVLGEGNGNPAAGDLSPEGMAFISSSRSPNGEPLLVVGNEVSGTTSVYEVRHVLRRGSEKQQ